MVDSPSPNPAPNWIVGVVELVSRIPDPASSEYANCASRILVKSQGSIRLCSGVAFADRKLTPFGQIAAGERVRLHIQPADTVARSEQTRFRVADDTDRFDLEQVWVDRVELIGAHREPQETTATAEKFAADRAIESAFIRQALCASPALIGGIDSDFFFYGDRRFYRDDFWKEKPESQNSAGIRDCLLEFQQLLAARGIEFYLAVIPVASSIYPDYAVNQFFDPAVHEPPNEPVRAMLRDLAAQGVRTVDLTPVLLANRWLEFEGECYPVYRPNDSHWAPAGAKIAAAEIARVIRETTAHPELLDQVPAETFREKSELMVFESDIAQIIKSKYPHWSVDVNPHQTPSLQVLADRKPGAWLASFDRPDAPIQLIGDSFVHKLADTQSGLHAHLTAELSAPLHSFHRYGSGGRVMQDWLDSTDFDAPKIVILAVAEKYACYDDLWARLRAPETRISASGK